MRRFLTGFLLALLLAAPLAGQNLVLTHANVVDVVGGTILNDVTLVVSDGRIQPAGTPPGESEAPVVDLHGWYVAPGLIDAHVHVGNIADARRALQYGVTTMRSAGVSHYVDVGMRELQRGGSVDVPEYVSTGYHVRPDPAEGLWEDHPQLGPYMASGIRGTKAIRAMARAILSRNVDFLKVLATERAGVPTTDPRKQVYGEEELRALVEEGEARGVPVMAHAHGDAGARAAVRAGVRSIEHGTYLSRETLQLMKDRGTYLVPTIAIVRDLTIPGGDYDDAFLEIRGRHMLPRVREMARMAHELGVKIVAGTDTGYGPRSTTTLAHEMMELVDIGMTPLEALRAATVTAAELLRVDDHTGKVAAGLQADLIVLERNPLDDIGVVQDVQMVISDGKIVARHGDWAEEGAAGTR